MDTQRALQDALEAVRRDDRDANRNVILLDDFEVAVLLSGWKEIIERWKKADATDEDSRMEYAAACMILIKITKALP